MKDVTLKDTFAETALQKYGADKPAADVVDDILLVGALFNRSAKGDVLDGVDEMELSNLVEQGSELGIKFSKSPRVRVCNLEYGHDFLKAADVTTKMVVFCHVYYNPDSVGFSYFDCTQQSTRAAMRDVWHERVKATGAMYAVNIEGYGDELQTDLLVKGGYRVLHQNVPMTKKGIGFSTMDIVAKVA